MSPVRMGKIETPSRKVMAYKDAFNNRDVDAILALLDDECVFEPPQNGLVLKGKAEIKPYLTEFFARLPDGKMKGIDLFQAGVFVIFRWELNGNGGADIFKLRDGLIVEKFSYLKS